MSRSKPLIYLIIFFIALTLFCYYYRYFFIKQWMRLALRNEPVIVTLSTTPYRINDMEATIQSILQQYRKPDQIYLSVPYIFKRDNIAYVLPDWLNNYPEIKILRTEDYGPATKLLGALAQGELPPNAILITIDDDAIYPENFVLELAYHAHKNPNAAVGILGANPIYDADGLIDLNSELGIKKISAENAKVSILQGYTGVAYRPKFFNEQVFYIVDAPQECIKSDDIYLSFFLARNNIDRIVLHNMHINPCRIKWQTDRAIDNNALHKLTPGPTVKHRICLAFLQAQYPDVNF